MTKKGKKILIMGICAVVLVALASGVVYLMRVARYRQIVSDIVITNPDLSEFTDGIYYGSVDALLVGADVRVIVENQRIVDIDLEHKGTSRGEPVFVVIDHVLDQQTLEVDAISGATNSGKVILSAIEDALTSEN